MTAFATAAELQAFTGRDYDDTHADAVLAAVSDEIRGVANQQVDITATPSNTTVELAGTWGDSVTLPDRPVTEVVSVTVDGTAVSTADWFFHRPDQVVKPGGFDGPEYPITVVYKHARSAVPGWLKTLTMRVAARTIGNPTGALQETNADYTISHMRSDTMLTPAERKMVRSRLGRTARTITVGPA